MHGVLMVLEVLCVLLLVALGANEVRRVVNRHRAHELPTEPESVRRELVFDVPGGTQAVVNVLVREAHAAQIVSPSTPRLTLVEQSRCHAEFRFGTTAETDWIVSICLEPLDREGWSRGSLAVNAWRPDVAGADVRTVEVAHRSELTDLQQAIQAGLQNMGGHVSYVTR